MIGQNKWEGAITKTWKKNLKFEDLSYPVVSYMFKVSNKSTITRCEICSKLTMNTPERRHR